MYENQFSSRIGERTFRNGTNTMLFRSYKMDQQDQFSVLLGFLFLFELDDQMHELCIHVDLFGQVQFSKFAFSL